MAPPRHFAGRVPPPTSSSSSDEQPASRLAPVLPSRTTVPRRRLVPRVVATAPAPPQSAPVGSFVPVRALHNGSPSASDSPSSVRSSSSASSLASVDAAARAAQYATSADDNDDDDSDDGCGAALPRPVFVHAGARKVTAAAAAEAVMDESAIRAAQAKQLRRREARRMVTEVLVEEERNARALGVAVDDGVDDIDHESDAERELALWRVREMRRVKRDRDEAAEWARARAPDRAACARATEGEAVAVTTVRGMEVTGLAVGDGAQTMGVVEATERKEAAGQKRFKVGPFFLDKGDDGRYREEIYNRDYSKGTDADREKQYEVMGAMHAQSGDIGKAAR